MIALPSSEFSAATHAVYTWLLLNDSAAPLQAGTVVEQGTHSALYSDEASVYHSLVRLQEQATDKHDEMAQGLDFEAAAAADEAAAAEAAAEATRPSVDGRASGRQSGLAASRLSLEHGGKAGSKGEIVSAKELLEQAAEADEDELVRCPPLCLP